jgi:hypothetical protein
MTKHRSRRSPHPDGITTRPRPGATGSSASSQATRSDTGITQGPITPAGIGSPAGTGRSLRRIGGGVAIAALAAAITGVVVMILMRESADSELERTGKRLCEEFARLKKLGDPSAAQLLGRVPTPPATPVSEEDADSLQADYFLADSIEVLSVKTSPKHRNQFILVTKGNVSPPTLAVRTRKGIENSQRMLFNPDVLVEVRDGKIYGVAARLHEGN